MSNPESNMPAPQLDAEVILQVLNLLDEASEEVVSDQDAGFRETIADVFLDADRHIAAARDTVLTDLALLLNTAVPRLLKHIRAEEAASKTELQEVHAAATVHVNAMKNSLLEKLKAQGGKFEVRVGAKPEQTQSERIRKADAAMEEIREFAFDARANAQSEPERNVIHDLHEHARLGKLQSDRMKVVVERRKQILLGLEKIMMADLLIQSAANKDDASNAVEGE